MRVFSVIVAAGKGRRFGSKKQFEILKGKPVVEYSIDVLKDFSERVIVVVEREDIGWIKERYPFVDVTEGGMERMHSVWNGISAIQGEGIVLVHDAARPLITHEFVRSIIDAAKKHGSAVPVMPIHETVKVVSGGVIRKTVDRSLYYAAQTPQAFDLERLKRAYTQALKGGKIYTDESAVWEEFDSPARAVDGMKRNIKITTKEEFRIAECLLG